MEKQGIEKVLEEFDEKWPHQMSVYGERNEIRKFLRSAIETAFKEVRPEDKVKQEKICSCGSYERCNKCDSDSERMKRIGYNDAISDYDQAVKNYLGK